MPNIKNPETRGAFTLVEVLLVLMLVAISTGLGVLYSQTAQVRADVNGQATVLASDLRWVQSQALSGDSDAAHGIHFETNGYTLFEGALYDALNPLNRIVVFSSGVEIQNINLNGGGTEVIFTPPYGETSTHGSIEVVSTQSEQSITLTITPLGSVSY